MLSMAWLDTFCTSGFVDDVMFAHNSRNKRREKYIGRYSQRLLTDQHNTRAESAVYDLLDTDLQS